MAFLTITENVNASSGPATSPIGPLASLYTNRYKGDNLTYPRDLGTSYRGHSVGFQFVKVNPAGLQAIETAKRLGAVVSATDVRAATKEQVESLGGKFIMVEDDEAENAETAGGYAKEMSEDYKYGDKVRLKKPFWKDGEDLGDLDGYVVSTFDYVIVNLFCYGGNPVKCLRYEIEKIDDWDT